MKVRGKSEAATTDQTKQIKVTYFSVYGMRIELMTVNNYLTNAATQKKNNNTECS